MPNQTYGDFVDQIADCDDSRSIEERQSSYILVKADRKSITLKSVIAVGDNDAMQKFGITAKDMELSMAVDDLEYRLICLDIDLWISGTCASDRVYDFS